DGVVEGRDVVDGTLFIDSVCCPAAVELLASHEDLPAVLRLQDALRAEHTVPDAIGPRALTVELPRAEGDADVVGIGEDDAERVPARAHVANHPSPRSAGREGRPPHD